MLPFKSIWIRFNCGLSIKQIGCKTLFIILRRSLPLSYKEREPNKAINCDWYCLISSFFLHIWRSDTYFIKEVGRLGTNSGARDDYSITSVIRIISQKIQKSSSILLLAILHCHISHWNLSFQNMFCQPFPTRSTDHSDRTNSVLVALFV